MMMQDSYNPMLPKNQTDSSELVINDKTYNPIRIRNIQCPHPEDQGETSDWQGFVAGGAEISQVYEPLSKTFDEPKPLKRRASRSKSKKKTKKRGQSRNHHKSTSTGKSQVSYKSQRSHSSNLKRRGSTRMSIKENPPHQASPFREAVSPDLQFQMGDGMLDNRPEGILKTSSKSPSRRNDQVARDDSEERQQHQPSSNSSSPYVRSNHHVGNSYLSRSYRSRSRSQYASENKSNNLPTTDKKDIFLYGKGDGRRGRPEGAHVSNQVGYQVVRDDRGFKRKIEYCDDEEDRET